MAFECQRDSYKREFCSRVIGCELSSSDPSQFQVVLEDTILFPEGGGQPEDTGTLNGDIQVVHVKRDGGRAVHYTTAAVEMGSEVQISLNWERRWDHMQQHSGQHLITAVVESKFGFKTVSWCLGVGKNNKSFIELDTPKVSAQQLEAAEQECNRLIAEARPVQVRIIDKESEEFNLVRSRGLPSGSVGPIRVIDMEGVDVNMCCGTHVANLSHLQSVKLLHAEQKGPSAALLHFVVGDRVRTQLGRMYAAERALTKLLSCSPEEHLKQVERLGKTQRAEAKLNKSYLREIAELTAASHLSTPLASEPFFLLHREDADMEFMSALCSSLLPHKQVVLVTGGGKKGTGIFMMSGPAQLVAELGPQVAEILVGKGGGKGAKYQGKVQKIENYKVAFEFVKNFIVSF